MTLYLIRPLGLVQRSKAWAPTLRKARRIKAQLQQLTGLKWRIAKKKLL